MTASLDRGSGCASDELEALSVSARGHSPRVLEAAVSARVQGLRVLEAAVGGPVGTVVSYAGARE